MPLAKLYRKPSIATKDSVNDAREREQLDGLVVNMELTLISIIQGVALYFLIDTGRTLIVDLQFAYWPYIAVGLMTILLFWSRSLIHTFTVIRWPLEFGHNFLYIACTLMEAVMFTQIRNPVSWYTCGTIYSCMICFLFVFDLGMIRRRRDECGEEDKRALCELLERDQLFNARVLMPLLIAFHLTAAIALRIWPEFLIARSWHLLFGGAQLLGGALYLAYVLNFFARIAPSILRWRERDS